MAFVELEDGSWINPDLIVKMFKPEPSADFWWAVLNHGETTAITDADRARILKAAGFVRAKKEKDDE